MDGHEEKVGYNGETEDKVIKDDSKILFLHNQGGEFFNWDKKETLNCSSLPFSRILGIKSKFEGRKFAVEEYFLPKKFKFEVVEAQAQARLKFLNFLDILNKRTTLPYQAVLIDELVIENNQYTAVSVISDAPDDTLESLIQSETFISFSEMVKLLEEICNSLFAFKQHKVNHLEISPNSIVFISNGEESRTYSLTHWGVRQFIEAGFIDAYGGYRAPDERHEHVQEELDRLDVYALVFSALEAFGIPFNDLNGIRSSLNKKDRFELPKLSSDDNFDENSLISYTAKMLLNCLLPYTNQRNSIEDLLSGIEVLKEYLPRLKLSPEQLLNALTKVEDVLPFYNSNDGTLRDEPEANLKNDNVLHSDRGQLDVSKTNIKDNAEREQPIVQNELDQQPTQEKPQNFQDSIVGNVHVEDEIQNSEDVKLEIDPNSKQATELEEIRSDLVSFDQPLTSQDRILNVQSPRGAKDDTQTNPNDSPVAIQETDTNLITERNSSKKSIFSKQGDSSQKYLDPIAEEEGEAKNPDQGEQRSCMYQTMSIIHCILLFWFMITVLISAIVIRAGSSGSFNTKAAAVARGLLGIGYLYQKLPITDISAVPAGSECPSGTDNYIGTWPGIQRFCYNPALDEISLGICDMTECRFNCQQYQEGFFQYFDSWQGMKFCFTRANYTIAETCPNGFLKCENSFCVSSTVCPITLVTITDNSTSAVPLPDGRYLSFIRDVGGASGALADFNLTINKQICLADHEQPAVTRYPALNVQDGGCGAYSTATNTYQIDSDVDQLELFKNQSWWETVSKLPKIAEYMSNEMELVQVNYFALTANCTTFSQQAFLDAQNKFDNFVGRVNASAWAVIFFIATFDLAILMLFIRDIAHGSRVTLLADPKKNEEDRAKKIGVVITHWMFIVVVTVIGSFISINYAGGNIVDLYENEIKMAGACFIDSGPQAVVASLSDLIENQLITIRGIFVFMLVASLVGFVPILIIQLLRKCLQGCRLLAVDVKKAVNERPQGQ